MTCRNTKDNFLSLKQEVQLMKFHYFFLFSLLFINCLLNADNNQIECNQIKKIPAEVLLSMIEMQKIQMEYDEDFWFNRDFEKFRHVLLHLVDDVGKIAKYCETKEHGKEPDPSELINKVLPDLLMHTLQFSNAFEIDLGEKYEARINSNMRKITISNAKSNFIDEAKNN